MSKCYNIRKMAEHCLIVLIGLVWFDGHNKCISTIQTHIHTYIHYIHIYIHIFIIYTYTYIYSLYTHIHTGLYAEFGARGGKMKIFKI